MSLSFAQGLVPEAYVAEIDRVKEYLVLSQLAVKFLRYSPLVALDADYEEAFLKGALKRLSPAYKGLVLDLTGTDRLFGAPATVAADIHRRLHRQGISNRVAVASTIGAAWALSRYARPELCVVEPGGEREALSTLPLQGLRVEAESFEKFRDLGLATIGDVLKLSERSLGARFGAKLLKRVCQLKGEVEETFCSVSEKQLQVISREFLFPVAHRERLQRQVEGAFTALFKKLDQGHLCATSFLIRLEGAQDDGTLKICTKELGFHAPIVSEVSVRKILTSVMEGVRQVSEVSKVTVMALDAVERAYSQPELMGGESGVESERAAAELFDQLAYKLGRDRLFRMELRESFVPEESYSFRSCMDEQNRGPAAFVPEQFSRCRPPLLLREPRELQVICMLPDKPPSMLIDQSRRTRIIRGFGPERVGREWWRGESAQSRRDYFSVQDEKGRWLWIYRDLETQRWFIQGLWG